MNSSPRQRGGSTIPDGVYRIACIDANGIAMKAEEFQHIMVDNQIEHLFICETWVGASSTRNQRLALNERYKGNEGIRVSGPRRAHYGTAVMLHPKYDKDGSCLIRREGSQEGFTLRTFSGGLEVAGVYLSNCWSATECIEVIEPLANDMH